MEIVKIIDRISTFKDCFTVCSQHTLRQELARNNINYGKSYVKALTKFMPSLFTVFI